MKGEMGMTITSLTMYENRLGVLHVCGFNYPQKLISYKINIGFLEFYYKSNGTIKKFIIDYGDIISINKFWEWITFESDPIRIGVLYEGIFLSEETQSKKTKECRHIEIRFLDENNEPIYAVFRSYDESYNDKFEHYFINALEIAIKGTHNSEFKINEINSSKSLLNNEAEYLKSLKNIRVLEKKLIKENVDEAVERLKKISFDENKGFYGCAIFILIIFLIFIVISTIGFIFEKLNKSYLDKNTDKELSYQYKNTAQNTEMESDLIENTESISDEKDINLLVEEIENRYVDTLNSIKNMEISKVNNTIYYDLNNDIKRIDIINSNAISECYVDDNNIYFINIKHGLNENKLYYVDNELIRWIDNDYEIHDLEYSNEIFNEYRSLSIELKEKYLLKNNLNYYEIDSRESFLKVDNVEQSVKEIRVVYQEIISNLDNYYKYSIENTTFYIDNNNEVRRIDFIDGNIRKEFYYSDEYLVFAFFVNSNGFEDRFYYGESTNGEKEIGFRWINDKKIIDQDFNSLEYVNTMNEVLNEGRELLIVH